MAIEIWNIFNNKSIQKDLKSRKFPTPAMYKDGKKMELIFPLVVFKIKPDPLGIEFNHIGSNVCQGMTYNYISFNEWWRKEIAHQPMRPPGDPGVIDVIDLTRFGIIRSIRNKLAAHHDNIRPRLLDELEQSMLISGWSFDIGGTSYRIGDGKFSVLYPYMYALLRQIGHEALSAFDISGSS